MEICFQEVVVNIDLIGEIKDVGLDVEDKLGFLKEMEMDCGDILEQAAVSDWSPSGLDLPQISEDSVVRGAAVAPSIDYEVSSCL